MKTTFSRAIRKQLLTIDMVYALFIDLRQHNKLNFEQRACVDRIDKRIKNIQQIHYGKTSCGENKLNFTKNNLKQYKKLITALRKIIDDLQMDRLGLEFYNAVLLLVDSACISSKKSSNKQLYKEWNFLNRSMMTLYKHQDPEIKEHKYMISGGIIGNRMLEVIG